MDWYSGSQIQHVIKINLDCDLKYNKIDDIIIL